MSSIRKLGVMAVTGLVAGGMASTALADEHTIGEPLKKHGLVMQPVYLQPVTMAPEMPGMSSMKADVHLELDVHAAKNNKQGFAAGAWVPYLTISYKIEKKKSDWSAFGTLMAMVASDGPHYGHNVQLDGPGKYTVTFKLVPPPRNGFLRHTSRVTGVPAWWQPFKHSWTFTYVGVGKKGGY